MSLSDVSRDDSVRPVVLSDAPTWCDSDVARRAWQIGAEFAAPHADDVDRSARFPEEAVAEIRASGLLAAMIPTELGGGGASLAEVATAGREAGLRSALPPECHHRAIATRTPICRVTRTVASVNRL